PRATSLATSGAALAPSAAHAQPAGGTIQGTVRGETGAPLGDVTIAVVGTRFGVLSRPDGRYTITGVAPGTYQVRATRIGYAAHETSVTVNPGGTVAADFTIRTVAVSLEQMVVIGYGTQTKRDLTGSVGSVQASQIATMPVPRVDQAISGLV